MTKDLHYCLNCGQELGGHKKYCNTHCQMEFQYQQYIDRWKNGLESGLRGEYQISLHIRRYLFEKYNSKCAMCGWGEMNVWTRCIPLEVHHIDGDYTNNIESNLTLLCPNCHSLTETYKALNKNGRVERNKYYS
jgi:predicted restriction endonuclease